MISLRRSIDEMQYKRTKFRSSTPALTFDSVEFNGNLQSQAKYFKRSLKLNTGNIIPSSKLKPAYYRLTSNDKIKAPIPLQHTMKKEKLSNYLWPLRKRRSFEPLLVE
ncbi:MAG: hypothetical protein JKY48_07550 [Flavobacteriales bacterium]|nr:hypothetical protein [Flavobacteriales bacterium]